jgi:4-amino-4-deoxy-L-arabinose transferase-like glycosyltransferase
MWKPTLSHAELQRRTPINVLSSPGRAVLILIAIATWLVVTAWWRPLGLPDEGRYVGVAWEMLHARDWLVPTLDGLPFFHKPPLWYWLTAAAMSAFGIHEWTVRLASALGATLAAWTLYLFVRRWAGETRARRALVVLLTMPLYFGGAQYANHDMLVAAFVAMAILAAAHAALQREAGAPFGSALLAAYAFAALGVLTKGLIGAVLPALVFVAWMLKTRRARSLVLLAWWPGWVLFAMIAVPWFVAMQIRHDGFLDYFFVVQQFKRFAVGGFNNVRDWWFYVAALALLTLPWSPWLALTLQPRFFTDGPQRDLRVLMGLWVLVVVVFFSLPSSKLIGYVLPALPPLAFLIAEVVATRAMRLTAVIAAVACVGIVIGVGIAAPHSVKPAVAFVRAQMAPRDRVLMLDHYVHDLAFYLQRADPVPVASDWTGGTSGDDWRHELLDAAAFDPASARRVLLPSGQLPAPLCGSGTTWIFADPDAAQRHPWLGQAVYADRYVAVWRWAAGSAAPTGCR